METHTTLVLLGLGAQWATILIIGVRGLMMIGSFRQQLEANTKAVEKLSDALLQHAMKIGQLEGKMDAATVHL